MLTLAGIGMPTTQRVTTKLDENPIGTLQITNSQFN